MTDAQAEIAWPCALRGVHVPHVAEWVQRAHEGTPATTTERGSYDCPGVPQCDSRPGWGQCTGPAGHPGRHGRLDGGSWPNEDIPPDMPREAKA